MAVGIKKMVHRIFKEIVPHTNKHDLELTLLRQINTLQTLRYLANGGSDGQVQSTLFTNIIMDPKLQMLLSGWCIDNHNLSIHSYSNDDDIESDGKKLFLLSHGQNCFAIVTTLFCSNESRTIL